MSAPPKEPAGAAVQLFLYPNGFDDGTGDVLIDTEGGRWLELPDGELVPWYGVLPLMYDEEAALAQAEAMAASSWGLS